MELEGAGLFFILNIYLSTGKKISAPIRLAMITLCKSGSSSLSMTRYKIGVLSCQRMMYRISFIIPLLNKKPTILVDYFWFCFEQTKSKASYLISRLIFTITEPLNNWFFVIINLLLTLQRSLASSKNLSREVIHSFDKFYPALAEGHRGFNLTKFSSIKLSIFPRG